MKDCLTNQPGFSQVLLTYTRVEPTKFQLWVRVRVRVRVRVSKLDEIRVRVRVSLVGSLIGAPSVHLTLLSNLKV